MEICSIASGSNGNAIYVGSEQSGVSVLLDCGISRRQLRQRLAKIGKDLNQISAIFITHEHFDHVKGLQVTCKYHSVPIYLTQGTWYGLRRRIKIDNCRIIQKNEIIQLADLTIEAIPKSHDACEPIAFTITQNQNRLFYATDFGMPNEAIISQIKTANIILLETNYDPIMLENGPYPHYLKRRILSPRGHMSNIESAQLIRDYASPQLSHLILGHISENNNHPQLAWQEVQRVIAERNDLHPEIIIASRYEAGELIRLHY